MRGHPAPTEAGLSHCDLKQVDWLVSSAVFVSKILLTISWAISIKVHFSLKCTFILVLDITKQLCVIQYQLANT